jgi:REP element-mobilizing transposase RayT
MNSAQSSEPQQLPLEEQLVGVNAKTGLYPGARSWSGGRRRILGKGPLESYCYHVMSRTCGGEVFFDEVEKEALRRVIWRMAEFCGIKVVNYCLMGNHFHLLAEVPHRESWLQRFEGPLGEAKLLEHLRILYSKTYVGLLRDELSDLRQRGLETLAQQKLEALKKRFCELSLFVKEVKERFSRWFNKRRGRRGTLWMDRFKSVLVEDGEALRTMALYIDLNPVRAGLVDDPKDYRWTGYGEATGSAGIDLVSRNPTAAEAFRFANRAMWQQRIHSILGERRRRGEAAGGAGHARPVPAAGRHRSRRSRRAGYPPAPW